jgi:glycosyltransferase involved in cell wall biosynthesis
VRELMARASLLCMPCIVGDDGNRDALPTALLEAQAMGLPCISTPVTGIPEILDGGRAGVLVPENDPQATARAIEALLADRARRDALARAGRARAEELFDARACARTLRGWFEESADLHAPRALERTA